MKKLSVILPIHEYNDTVKELFERSVYSYLEADLDRESELLIITTSELKNSIETDGKKFCRGAQWKVLTTEQSDFCSMVNYGATQASEYFQYLNMMMSIGIHGLIMYKNRLIITIYVCFICRCAKLLTMIH